MTYLFVIYRPVCFSRENRLIFVGRDTFAYIYVHQDVHCTRGGSCMGGTQELVIHVLKLNWPSTQAENGGGKIAPNAADWYI